MADSRIDDRDKLFVEEFAEGLATALDSISLSVFLCGKGLDRRASRRGDIRTYLQAMLEAEVKSCRVKLGEHKLLIRAYKRVAGSRASNLADHEFALAQKIDLLVIFPSSAGSIAELGMFCLEDDIAQKMVIFLSRKYRKSTSYVVNGPVAAARRRNSKIFFVNYTDRSRIWKEIKSLVLDIRANKGRKKLLKS
jgi:hypothetical protein